MIVRLLLELVNVTGWVLQHPVFLDHEDHVHVVLSLVIFDQLHQTYIHLEGKCVEGWIC